MKNLIRLLRYDWPLHFILVFTNWMPDNVLILKLRGWLCRPFFKKCGKNLRLGRNITFYNSSKIEIGNDVYIAFNNWLSAGVLITIGDKVNIGPGCVFASGSHQLKNGNFNDATNYENENIKIESGCWIAANVNVAGGTTIGKGSLVAAGCSVKGIYPDEVLIATQIATVKRKLS